MGIETKVPGYVRSTYNIYVLLTSLGTYDRILVPIGGRYKIQYMNLWGNLTDDLEKNTAFGLTSRRVLRRNH